MADYNNKTTEIKYFIAWSDEVSHSGELEPEQQVSTGLDNLEIFDDEDLWQNRINELSADE